MFKVIASIAVSVVVLTGVSTAFAADGKPARVTTCDHYSIAKTDEGKEIGLCAARKAGGKPSMLRTFTIVSMTDPDGKPVKVMVGYR